MPPAETPSAVIGRGSSTVFEIPANAFPRFALMAAAMKLEGPFAILHAPANFVNLVIAYVISQKPFWFPDSLGPAMWQCITYPLFAAPAWFFVGQGIERLRRGNSGSQIPSDRGRGALFGFRGNRRCTSVRPGAGSWLGTRACRRVYAVDAPFCNPSLCVVKADVRKSAWLDSVFGT